MLTQFYVYSAAEILIMQSDGFNKTSVGAAIDFFQAFYEIPSSFAFKSLNVSL